MGVFVLELKRKGMKYDLHIDGPIGYWMTASSIRSKMEEICRARGEELGEGGCGNGSANGGGCGNGGGGGCGGGCGNGGGKEVAELTVRICSPGGSLSEGLAICALFRDHGNVHAYIQGMTASAATVLAMGAKKVSMSSESVILVHNASYMLLEWEQANKERLAEKQEEYEGLRRDLSTLDGVMARLYAKRSGRSEEEMSSLMTDERWLSAEEALSLGLVDEIIGDESADRGADGVGVDASVGRGVNGVGVRSGVDMGARFVRAYCASYGLPALQVVDEPLGGDGLDGRKCEKSVLDGEKRNFWAKLVEFFADSSNPKNRKDMENPELKAVTEERDTLQARVTTLEESVKAVTEERDKLQARVGELEQKEKAVTQERDALQARVGELEKEAKADGAETPVVEGVSGEKNDDFGNVVASAREMLKSLGEL